MNEILINSPQVKIYKIRGVYVMLDSDVSRLYKTTTRLVNLARKRRIDVLGSLTFKLTKKEFHDLAKENNLRIYNSYNPIAYTEEACYKLASYLNSPTADKMVDLMYKAFKAVKDRQLIIMDNNPTINQLTIEIGKINEQMKGFSQQPIINNHFNAPVNYIQGSHNIQNIQVSNSEELLNSLLTIMKDSKVNQNQQLMDHFIKTLDSVNKKDNQSVLDYLEKIASIGSNLTSISTGIPNIINFVKSLF